MTKRWVQIKDSYNIWSPQIMKAKILEKEPNWCGIKLFIIIEWWLHNIGYYITLPFISNSFLAHINLRCKDVDLMIPVKETDNETH